MSETVGDAPAAGTVVSGDAAGEERVGADIAVYVRVADGPLVGPALRRMVSIVLARVDWPLDALDDALLVCDALSAHTPAHAREGWVALSLKANEREAELRVGELTGEGAAQLLDDARLPVVGNVLEGIADRVSVEPEEGGGSRLVLVLSAS
jgi:serine/threonine-protein kinase RsbW